MARHVDLEQLLHGENFYQGLGVLQNVFRRAYAAAKEDHTIVQELIISRIKNIAVELTAYQIANDGYPSTYDSSSQSLKQNVEGLLEYLDTKNLGVNIDCTAASDGISNMHLHFIKQMERASKKESFNVEADRRTSVGRSYYAVYNLVHDGLAIEGVRFSNKGEDHGRLVYYMNGCQDRTAVKIAAILRDLRAHRTVADYEMAAVVGPKTSELAYRWAASGIQHFSGLNIQRLARLIQALPPYPPKRS